MHPIYKVNLPRISEELEYKLIAVALQYESFKYNNGTIGQKYYEEGITSDRIETLKQLYGFDHIPQHRSQGFDVTLQNVVRNTLDLPMINSMYVQVIESADSFIHTDGGHRKCSLYYLMSDNKPSVTKFYTTTEEPFVSTVYRPQDVTEYFSYEMKQHCWHVFNHDEIHSVNNIKGLRIGLIVDMTKQFKDYEQFVMFLKNRGLIDA